MQIIIEIMKSAWWEIRANLDPHLSILDPVFELDEYLELLDWMGRQVKEGKPGKIPGHVAHILERLEIEADSWVHTVLYFGSLFHRVAGKVQSILEATRRAGQQWLTGKPAAKQIFG